MKNNQEMWIWDEYNKFSGSPSGKSELLYFRRTFFIQDMPVALSVKVSADSRYRLYINGISVLAGPCKGGTGRMFYEEMDISTYLRAGKNVLSAKVLHLPQITPYVKGSAGADSISRSCCGGFILKGAVTDKTGRVIEDIGTDSVWKVSREDGIDFRPGIYGLSSMLYESFNSLHVKNSWNLKEYDDSSWQNAVPVCDSSFSDNALTAYGISHWWELTKRPIPQLYEKPTRFLGVASISNDNMKMERVLKGEGSIQFAPNSQYFVELDAGELTTGYFCIKTSGGSGSIIRIMYSECYEEYAEGIYRKGRRDNTNGVLRGDSDTYLPGGDTVFEPFWFRTFRYIRIDINTRAEALVLNDCFYREIGYPLDVKGSFDSNDLSLVKMWQISLRTLKRCMHETYEDCPYYEQLQYIMDTRLQALYTYQVSSDDRLARKALEDFHQSMLPCGLLQSRYPSVVKQIIPIFSLHWIFMIEDQLRYFGDVELVKKYRPTVDAILDWFDRKITEKGLVGNTGYWPFVDWVEGWDQNSVPTAYRYGPITVDSLVYACALESAAVLNDVSGRSGVAREYRERADKIRGAVGTHCWDDNLSFFTDGPGIMEYSQHAQVWAILANVVDGSEAVRLMERTMNGKMAKVSYAMAFFLFRALEKTGLYGKYAQGFWDIWRVMMAQSLTTWVEDPVSQRSDCHGWGALPLYELSAMVLGVKPGEVGEKAVHIKPVTCSLKNAEGTVMTCNGPVHIGWNVNENEFNIQISGPEGMKYIIEMPDGNSTEADENMIIKKCICADLL